ncbi:MAG: rhomboid family intramembrane serine protease [Pseudomonadota bacterium]
MFLPLHDQNPLRVIPLQVTTVALIALCTGVFLWQLGLSDAALGLAHASYGMTPAVLLGHAEYRLDQALPHAAITPLTSLFLHGGWMHLIGNMAYLWVFGDNVEDAMGHVRFVFFYLICGCIASGAHALAEPQSMAPLIGASGAVSGILGAYLLLHPRVKVLVLAFNRFPVHLPAYVLLVVWFGWQLWQGYANPDGTVAWWAHIGGFVAGAVLIPAFKLRKVPLFDGTTVH